MPAFLRKLTHPLLAGLRRWLTYRPERAYMRGAVTLRADRRG
jgi:hypothetical protein